MTSFDPAAGAVNASPQALAWNMGVIGRMVSFWPMPITSACREMKVCRKFERWE